MSKLVGLGLLVVSVVGGFVLLLPSGGAGSTAAGACMYPKRPAGCLYDIELIAETRLPDIGVFGLTARFRRYRSDTISPRASSAESPFPLDFLAGVQREDDGHRHWFARYTDAEVHPQANVSGNRSSLLSGEYRSSGWRSGRVGP